MDKNDVEILNRLLDQYGPEKTLTYIKGYCVRKAEQVRKATVSNSSFALIYDMLAKAIGDILNPKPKEKR